MPKILKFHRKPLSHLELIPRITIYKIDVQERNNSYVIMDSVWNSMGYAAEGS